jgi:hypothetical protein
MGSGVKMEAFPEDEIEGGSVGSGSGWRRAKMIIISSIAKMPRVISAI